MNHGRSITKLLIGKHVEVCGTDRFPGNNIAPAGRTDENPQPGYTICRTSVKIGTNTVRSGKVSFLYGECKTLVASVGWVMNERNE
jgi:hypothetical protein